MSQENSVEISAATDVLNLGKGLSLHFQGDALVVKDKRAIKRDRSKRVCGVSVGSSKPEFTIPFYHIIWAESGDELSIDYVLVNKEKVTLKKLVCTVYDPLQPVANAWKEELLTRAYGQSQRGKRAKVLVNPHAGPGDADKIWEHEVKPLFVAARMPLDIVRTKYTGEAIEICENLDIESYDIVIPCSGDGLPYEVFNGLGKRPDAQRALKRLAVAHIPCGSGNGLSCNINGSFKAGPAALAIIKGVRTPMDLMSVTQGDKRLLSFLSQSFGIVAECDLGTENMRWMGAKRFDVGVVQRIFTKRTWPAEISVKTVMSDKNEIKTHYKQTRSEDFSVRKEKEVVGGSSVNGGSVSSQTDAAEGLPPLKYGTVNDKLPSDWETTTHDKLGNFYCGNMGYMAPNANFFPAALPNDGLMDLVVNDGNISALKYIDLMTSIESGHFYGNPLISYRKIVAYRLTPKQNDGYVSIDGERIEFKPFQVEIHQGLATVLTKNGRYEAPGPLGWDTGSL
ncbi:diacylglycerol kinase catalytic domain-containing protein [Truncatella angustata]|uniref:Diacylglycerol kinase catalytic domain-containing protein n=1 Tax=Truncatella angustata TaxID=152316 RepID=A0A9P8UC56_9PEZI|nr:diacylglycerol kinase catalytic domain-containing protein [Truncatella angustata]KAH6646296.1 diacylglycerol kinase catalytic domain-containing protein [Truncatella angustata]